MDAALTVDSQLRSTSTLREQALTGRIRALLVIFIIALVLSGLTAFPLESELRDPVRNRWVVTFGLIACAAVVPLALLAGALRGIPLFWRLIDCAFGVCGAALLWPCLRAINELEILSAKGVAEMTS